MVDLYPSMSTSMYLFQYLKKIFADVVLCLSMSMLFGFWPSWSMYANKCGVPVYVSLCLLMWMSLHRWLSMAVDVNMRWCLCFLMYVEDHLCRCIPNSNADITLIHPCQFYRYLVFNMSYIEYAIRYMFMEDYPSLSMPMNDSKLNFFIRHLFRNFFYFFLFLFIYFFYKKVKSPSTI